jgi:flagellin-specific chaperone FliS
MKRFMNIYKHNNNAGFSFDQLISKVFRKAEMLSEEMIEAIQVRNIEERYLKSEELMRIMVEVHDTFQSDNPIGIQSSMQRYCLQNMNLLTRINLKNDKELAIALREACGEIARVWDASKSSSVESQ